MSYCVNCGVKLDDGASVCPLCDTPVINPNILVDSRAPRHYPPPQIVTPVIQNHFSVIAASVLLLLGSVICLIIDAAINRSFTWSLVVAASAALFWIITLLPLLLPRTNAYTLTTLDSLCLVAYLYLMQLIFPQEAWLLSLGLPMVIACGLAVMLIIFLSQIGLLRKLSLISCSLTLLGALMVLLETRLDLFLDGRLHLQWSWVAFGVAFSLALLLAVIDIFQGLKNELKKRFHL
jgi:hypothetical protein